MYVTVAYSMTNRINMINLTEIRYYEPVLLQSSLASCQIVNSKGFGLNYLQCEVVALTVLIFVW